MRSWDTALLSEPDISFKLVFLFLWLQWMCPLWSPLTLAHFLTVPLPQACIILYRLASKDSFGKIWALLNVYQSCITLAGSATERSPRWPHTSSSLSGLYHILKKLLHISLPTNCPVPVRKAYPWLCHLCDKAFPFSNSSLACCVLCSKCQNPDPGNTFPSSLGDPIGAPLILGSSLSDDRICMGGVPLTKTGQQQGCSKQSPPSFHLRILPLNPHFFALIWWDFASPHL